MMRRTCFQVLIAAVSFQWPTIDAHGAEPVDTQRPNIILIMADDLGFSDLGCYGGEIQTPNLDALAVRGLRFTQFYNAGRCCPTRAALLTGLYPHQASVGHMESPLGPAAYQGVLNDRCVTIAEVLRTHGYQTLMSGKWNVGPTRPHWPTDRGFDRYFGLLRGASNYFAPQEGPRRHSSQFALDDKLVTTFPADFYATDAFTDFAVERVAEAAKRGPFFLYLAYTAPHSPLHAWPEDIAKYREVYDAGWDEIRARRHRRMIELGLVVAGQPISPRDRRVPEWSSLSADERRAEALKMAVYAAQVDRLDQGIGRLTEALRAAGVDDNTLILFLSDNGGDDQPEGATKDIPPGPKESSHIYGRPWANVSNTPLRGYKHEAHEGGIATPLVVSWPAVIRESRVTNEPGHVIDLAATCLDAAGAEYPATFAGLPSTPLEGKSLVPIFRTGKRNGHDAIYWEHEGNRAVREGRWKLVAKHRGRWELYDVLRDRTETHDLAAEQPEVVERLAAKYDAWATRCGVLPWDDVRPQK